MKCPYTANYRIITQCSREYDEDGQMTISTDIQNQEVQLIDCLKEECAAYKDGQCNYRG